MKFKQIECQPKPRATRLAKRSNANRRNPVARRRLVIEQLESRELLTLPPSYLGELRVELSIFNELSIEDTTRNAQRTLPTYTVPLLSNPSEISQIPRGQAIDTGRLITIEKPHFSSENRLAVSHSGYVGTTDVFDHRFGFSSLQSLARLNNPNTNSPTAPNVGLGAAQSIHEMRLTPLPNENFPVGTPIELSVLAVLQSIDRSACGLSGCHGNTDGSQLEIIASAEFVSPQGTQAFSFSERAETNPFLYNLAGVNVQTVVGTTASLHVHNLIRGNLVLDSERRNVEVNVAAIQARPITNVALAGGDIKWRSYEEGGGVESAIPGERKNPVICRVGFC